MASPLHSVHGKAGFAAVPCNDRRNAALGRVKMLVTHKSDLGLKALSAHVILRKEPRS